jgi:CRISPR type I-A-associated protein Csa5
LKREQFPIASKPTKRIGRTSEQKERENRQRKRASCAREQKKMTKSMALLDRLTYALNPESIRMAVADALRVIQYDQFSRNPSIVQAVDESGRPVVKVRTEERDEPIVIRGRLPSSEAVRRFIEEADPDLAKKVGAHAR